MFIATALALASASGRAAEAEGTPRSAALEVVQIEVAGDRAALARTRSVVSELFARLGVASIVTSSGEESAGLEGRPALVRAYFDLREPRSPSIVIVEGGSDRELLRRTLPESASLEISVEELGHVLYAVVEGLLQAPEPEPAPSPVPADAPRGPLEPVPEQPVSRKPGPAARGGSRVDVGAFLRLLSLGWSRAVPGAGVSVSARARQDGPAPGAMLNAAAHGATQVTYDEGVAGVRPFSVRLYPTLSIPTSDRTVIVGGLGAGLDWFRIERSRAPADGTSGVSSVLGVTLSSFLGARVEVGTGLTLDAGLSLDLDLTPHRFVTQTEAGRATLFELDRFRPGASVGASYSLTGEGAPAAGGASP